jgi:hypothetical protein
MTCTHSEDAGLRFASTNSEAHLKLHVAAAHIVCLLAHCVRLIFKLLRFIRLVENVLLLPDALLNVLQSNIVD